ncbi:MAG: hypothetical protein CO093_04005 [Alphaproteobacteria bacterium CG_4_9_14_3_um_filter_47_13]|nr:MAG: hypothetical protein CO093_04005 [Alphaproteobacteria bacterium CG_4_9_14_3_um_filter_47_13]
MYFHLLYNERAYVSVKKHSVYSHPVIHQMLSSWQIWIGKLEDSCGMMKFDKILFLNRSGSNVKNNAYRIIEE